MTTIKIKGSSLVSVDTLRAVLQAGELDATLDALGAAGGAQAQAAGC